MDKTRDNSFQASHIGSSRYLEQAFTVMRDLRRTVCFWIEDGDGGDATLRMTRKQYEEFDRRTRELMGWQRKE